MNSEKVINNMDKIAERINNLSLEGVNAVGDDGSVCVQIKGDTNRVREVIDTMCADPKIHVSRIGDGGQEGCIFINADDCNIHEDMEDVVC